MSFKKERYNIDLINFTGGDSSTHGGLKRSGKRNTSANMTEGKSKWGKKPKAIKKPVNDKPKSPIKKDPPKVPPKTPSKPKVPQLPQKPGDSIFGKKKEEQAKDARRP
tara:strand:+ start:6373 stop:6696 length:324 start_codon:yes stop_codon:yes gene_type:complete